MQITDARRPLVDRSNTAPVSTIPAGIPLWGRNPFAPQEKNITTLQRSPRTSESKAPVQIYDDTQSTVCPIDCSLPAYTPKVKFPALDDRHEEYWTFLKSAPVVQHGIRPTPSVCPSLASGGALSSRNSSTRSTRSSIWEASEDRNNNVRGVCLIPECNGLCFKDVNAHSRLTHFVEQRAEICPVESCERHRKSFSRAGDMKRHAFTHFNGSLVCGFCEPETTTFSQATDRVGLFLTHLVKSHGVKACHLDQEFNGGRANQDRRRSSDGQPVSTCSICLEPFTAQIMYEHLLACVLRKISRSEHASVWEGHNVSTRDLMAKADVETLTLPPPICSDDDISFTIDHHVSEDQPKASVETSVSECREVAELTASSRCLSLTSSKAMESSEEETDWTEDNTSRESSPGLSQVPHRLSPAKRKVVEAIMQQLHDIFASDARVRTAAGSSSGSSYNGSGGWSSNTSTYSSTSFMSRKRSLSGGGSTPPNDEDDSNKRRRPYSKSDGKESGNDARFACPYYKRNPGGHPTFTSCRDPGFTTIARLKEHLYRRHLLPPQCHRCCTTFANDIVLREHQRDVRGCEIKESIPLEGFDKEQERRLKSKKRSQTYQTEEQKWKGVYQILFPDDNESDVPSPYIEYQPTTTDAAKPSHVMRFQEFSRLELPRLVRRTLETVVEQEAQPLEERLKERLVDIVKECQTQLMTMFQATVVPSANNLSSPTSTPRYLNTDSTAAALSLPTQDLFHGFDSLPVRTLSPPDVPTFLDSTSAMSTTNTPLQPTIDQSRSSPLLPSFPFPWTTTTLTQQQDQSQQQQTPPLSTPFNPTLPTHNYPNLTGYYPLFNNTAPTTFPAPHLHDSSADDASSWAFLHATDGSVAAKLGVVGAGAGAGAGLGSESGAADFVLLSGDEGFAGAGWE